MIIARLDSACASYDDDPGLGPQTKAVADQPADGPAGLEPEVRGLPARRTSCPPTALTSYGNGDGRHPEQQP